MSKEMLRGSDEENHRRPLQMPIGGTMRDVAIDSLRGIAIILMVTGHVIGNVAETGMRVADDSGWRYFYLLLEDVRMPLFTALSGLVYGLRPLTTFSGYPRLIKGKVRRLLVPLVTVGLSFHVVQSLTPGTNSGSALSDAWRVLVYGGGVPLLVPTGRIYYLRASWRRGWLRSVYLPEESAAGHHVHGGHLCIYPGARGVGHLFS